MPSAERHDALYVVGSLDETLELRGMRYHPIDIETSVIQAHRRRRMVRARGPACSSCAVARTQGAATSLSRSRPQTHSANHVPETPCLVCLVFPLLFISLKLGSVPKCTGKM